MSNSVAGELRSAISSIRNKASEASNSSFLEEIKGSRVEAAKSQIGFAQNGVLRNERQVDDINSKLNPPPTKEVSSGKSGSKTVVDTEEVRSLESKKTVAEGGLNTAKTQVQNAEQEAQIATQEVLSQSGITKGLQSEIEALASKADAIKGSLAKGESVSEKDIKDLLKGLQKVGAQIKDPTKSFKEAFLNPMEERLTGILALVEANPDLVTSDDVSGNSEEDSDSSEVGSDEVAAIPESGAGTDA